MYIQNIVISNDTLRESITLAFSNSALYMLTSYTDNQSANNLTTNGYNQHGSTYVKTLMNNRPLQLSFILNMCSPNYSDAYEKMMRIFNPVLGLSTLAITTKRPDSTNAKTRTIDFFVAEPPSMTAQHGYILEYSVELTAPFPFYRDSEENYVEFTGTTGGFTFATQFDEANGKIFGLDGKTCTVNNQGDIPSPVTISISGNTMTNPTIYMPDGSFIGLTKEILSSYTVKITTEYGNKNILINGENALRYMATGSTWVQLPLGISSVTATCSSGSPICKLYWNNYYCSYI